VAFERPFLKYNGNCRDISNTSSVRYQLQENEIFGKKALGMGVANNASKKVVTKSAPFNKP
jgi:hypothetical protein